MDSEEVKFEQYFNTNLLNVLVFPVHLLQAVIQFGHKWLLNFCLVYTKTGINTVNGLYCKSITTTV